MSRYLSLVRQAFDCDEINEKSAATPLQTISPLPDAPDPHADSRYEKNEINEKSPPIVVDDPAQADAKGESPLDPAIVVSEARRRSVSEIRRHIEMITNRLDTSCELPGDRGALRYWHAILDARMLQEALLVATAPAPPEQCDVSLHDELRAAYEAKWGAGEPVRRLSVEELIGPAPWDELETNTVA